LNFYHPDPDRTLAAVFARPEAIHRGAPLWSWNDQLDLDLLKGQIDTLQQMGFGGFVIHSRTGLTTPYLGDEFMRLVRECVVYGRSHGLLAWLYDEDRWPSGYAGGLITRAATFRSRYLRFAPAGIELVLKPNAPAAVLLARYAVELREGCLNNARRLRGDDLPHENETHWHAHLCVEGDQGWFNYANYVDTLNADAIRAFLHATHDRYRSVVGEFFGSDIPAIFTDEPQLRYKFPLERSTDRFVIEFPWTDDLPASFQAEYSQDLLEHLPELFWERSDGAASVVRYRYHEHVAERFAQAYADTVGRWCVTHDLPLTGHVMHESTLTSQTGALGDAMRSYRAFGLPGIDILGDAREYNTAKQAQSAARQYGRPGVLSELYGVTDWDYDFRGHKSQGDWQAALGVTSRVHHLAWVSMRGEAKRDYPASISYQSPWHERYPLIEDHFARVNAALTRGGPLCRIGVIHPIESFWLCYGPLDQTRDEREQREQQFKSLTEWLLFAQLDFDFIAESLLPGLCPRVTGPRFEVGAMAYDGVIVPPLRTIRQSTLDRLLAFAGHGGNVMVLGNVPELVDAQSSDAPERLLDAGAVPLPFDRDGVVGALEPWRELRVVDGGGQRIDHVLHQLRAHEGGRLLFLCDTRRDDNTSKDPEFGRVPVCIRVKGAWDVEVMDTRTGAIHASVSDTRDGWTEWHTDLYPHGHALLHLSPRHEAVAERTIKHASPCLTTRDTQPFRGPVPITLSEPNALLLDCAAWRVDELDWQPAEDLLRINNRVRTRWGLPPQRGDIPQPWARQAPIRKRGRVSLRFDFRSRVALRSLLLTCEQPGQTSIQLDGHPVYSDETGWWVAHAIRTVPLADLQPGEHMLELDIAYDDDTSLEWCYLLGDFGVEVDGARATVCEPVRELDWGDITKQGLAFYTGNVTYHLSLPERGAHGVLVPRYAGALVGVSLNGGEQDAIIYPPYHCVFEQPAGGGVAVDLTLYGNRYNAFGALHAVGCDMWPGPDRWRTEGEQWRDAYQLRPLGVLEAPSLW